MSTRHPFRRLRWGSLGFGLLLLAPWSTTARAADVIGRIEIPRLHIGAIVAEGADVGTLRRAVGHIPSTARPGSPGNCALAGHRDTFLRGLGAVRSRDVIRVVTTDRTYTYRVEWSAVVEPRRVDVLDSTATRSLTLITCYPFVFAGHAPRRFVVRARQVDAGACSTTNRNRITFQRQGQAAGVTRAMDSQEGVRSCCTNSSWNTGSR
jgi:sortase A